ncbi:nitrite/sulfite reductase, partial [Sulfurovum sp.]|uniref:nitrite/sulfite reductase n=1 Tax=Sulfurovum sp. TaxID=1969726 RepID=UPI0025CC5BAC
MKPNKIERVKTHLAPYDFRSKINSLDLTDLDEEKRFYLKNYGIYNIKLTPEKFMLRIRIAGGRITQHTLQYITMLAKRYDLELLITARAQLELHGLHAKNVLAVWKLLEKENITTLQTLTDNFRNIVTDPYDGAEESSRIETFPLVTQMQDLFLDRQEWMGRLPRKFNTAICGTQKSSMHFFSNDLFFALAKKDEKLGFNLYLGGKNSEVAQDADVFVTAQNVPFMFEAVGRTYMKYGLRGTRSKNRLFHLLEETGVEAFVEHLAEFYPEEIMKKGELLIEKETSAAYKRLKDGTYGYCYQSRFGKLSVDALIELLEYAKKEALEIRIGPDQNLYLLGLKEKNVPFKTIQGASNVTACAGSHYCALSLWDIKSDISYLPLEKIDRYNIQVGFSGCLKGCGRHHHVDIGLVGLRTNSFGETQKAARVYLGGEYS